MFHFSQEGTHFWGEKHQMVFIIHEGSKSHTHFVTACLSISLSNNQTKAPSSFERARFSLKVPLHGVIVRSLVPVLQPIHTGVFLIFLEVLTGLFSSFFLSFFFFPPAFKKAAFNSPGAEGSHLLNHKVCHIEM